MSFSRTPVYTRPTIVTTSTIYCSASATGGTGTSVDPYSLAAIRANVVAGNLVLLTGDFTGTDSYLRDQDSPSGTASAWILYYQWPGQPTAILRGQTGGSTWPAFLCWGDSYVAVAGITLDNTHNSSDNIISRTSDNCQIVGCTIRTRGIKLGDTIGGATNSWVDGNNIDLIGSFIGNAGDGVFIQNGSSDNYVVRNVIGYCGHMGITDGGLSGLGEGACLRNTIALNTVTNPWAGGINVNGNGDGGTIQYNRVSDSGTSGLGAPGTEDGISCAGKNMSIQYNEIWDCDTEGIKLEASVFAGVTQSCTGNKVRNNTIYHCGGSAIGMVCRDALSAIVNLANNIIENNIGWSNHKNGATASGRFYNGAYRMVFVDLFNGGAVWALNSLGGNTFRNNYLARTTATDAWLTIIRTGGAGGDLNFTLASFQATFAGCSGNVESTDPKFTNQASDDFTLVIGQSSCIDAGIFVIGVPWADLGVDIGANESDTNGPNISILPIIDLLARADEAAILTPWTNKILAVTDSNLKIVSNKIAGTAANPAINAAYYNVLLGQIQGIYYDVATKPTDTEAIYLFLRLNTPGTAGVDGYAAVYVPLPGAEDDQFLIFRINNGSLTQLGAAITHDIQTGDGIGLTASDNVIVLWHRVAGIWGLFGVRIDASPIIADGYIGLGGNDTVFRLNNIGGGSLSPASETVTVGIGLDLLNHKIVH